MRAATEVFVILFYIFVACFVVGLYKPWAMLWWEAVQNRRKVLKLYGTLSMLSLLIYTLLKILSPAVA